ncbi:hypothetical protein KCV01_g15373, partial [Aureobasidium melanogenum]
MSSLLDSRFPGITQPLPLPPDQDESSLKAYLGGFSLDGAPPAELANYLNEDFRRFVYTLGLVPDRPGQLLEIGANPYFTTILLKRYRRYTIHCTNYFGIDGGGGRQTVRNAEANHEYAFDFMNNNVDVEDIPFDEVFDTILFCEVIEHLVTDPLNALRRIKARLAPGGALVLTTPNVNRLENITKMMAGQNIYDPISGYGVYGRHNREYNKHELYLMLDHLGFDLEALFSSDVHENHADAFYSSEPLAQQILAIPNRIHDLGHGGSGTRLWPLSRKNRPKQFLALVGEDTLFQQTLKRTRKLTTAGSPIVVCSEDHRFTVAEQIQELGIQGASILLEPAARNTAPAIALAAMKASSLNPEAVILVLPADHLIGDEASFVDAVRRAAPLADQGWLVTFGIRPEAPETGFGYIKRATALSDDGFKVAQFVEKPNAETAASYVASGDFDWNSGMFLFKASSFLDELKQHSPSIHEATLKVYASATPDLDFVRFDKEAMVAVPEDSIDYAVMEKTDRAAVVPVSCRWSDIGSWSALWEASDKDANGNATQGDVIAFDTRNTLVRSHDRHMVATVGLDDVVVISTPDATLVAARDKVQHVKQVVDNLSRSGRTEHLAHRQVYRPWGSYDSIDMGERFQVKRIVVKPG